MPAMTVSKHDVVTVLVLSMGGIRLHQEYVSGHVTSRSLKFNLILMAGVLLRAPRQQNCHVTAMLIFISYSIHYVLRGKTYDCSSTIKGSSQMPVTFSKLTKPPNKCYRHFNNVIKEVCY